MFGLPPITTQAEVEQAEVEPVTCMSFASSRTKALVDETRKQQKHVINNKRLPAGVKDNELAALASLGSALDELSNSIIQHDNAPLEVRKRDHLIRIEKARRQVLVAVRECGRRATESKKLFGEVEAFIELRPGESLTPRQMKQTQQPDIQQPRCHLPIRKLRPADSLCASILGLSDLADDRDVGMESTCSASGSATAASRLPSNEQQPPAGAQVPQKQPKDQGPPQADSATRPALGAIGVSSEGMLQRGAAPLNDAPPAGMNVPSSSDGDDDLRPLRLLDVGQSSVTTTMCNMDSCVTGPQRGVAGRTADGVHRRSDERYHGDGDDEDEEVNSAEGRCCADSPDRRVSLLGPIQRNVGLLAIASTDGTVAAPSPLNMSGLRAKFAKVTGAKTADTPQALPCSAPVAQLQPPLAHSGPSNRQQVASDAASTLCPVAPGAGVETSSAPSVWTLTEALRCQKSITSNRSYIGVEPRRAPNGSTASIALQQGPGAAAEPFTDETVPALAVAEELDAIDPGVDAPAAAPRYVATRHPAGCQPLNSYKLQGAAAAPAQHQHQDSIAGCRQPASHPPPHRLGQQHSSQHPAHAAAIAAAAAHPFTAHQHAQPISGPNSLRDFPVAPRPSRGPASDVGAGRYASQPPSGHQSLDSGRFPASATMTNWDNASIAETEPLPGVPDRRGRRNGRRRGGNGLFGLMRNVVGFVGVSVLSGAAMVLGAAAVNTGLDEQAAANQARSQGARRAPRLGRGGDELIPQRALQQLRSPDLLALGRG